MKTLLAFMGILSFFANLGLSQTKDLVFDLETFVCGNTKLGSAPDARDFFEQTLRASDTYKSVRDGFEVGTKHGVLNYIFITIPAYKGGFARSGRKITLNPEITPELIKAEFGEPYWIDSKDSDLILFYIYDGGQTELQFEFPDKKKLGFITLARDGVLSDAEQRQLYGVTKPWPPQIQSPKNKGG